VLRTGKRATKEVMKCGVDSIPMSGADEERATKEFMRCGVDSILVSRTDEERGRGQVPKRLRNVGLTLSSCSEVMKKKNEGV